MLAGMAFANAGVTAVHTFAYPIGAGFHIPHGIANTIMLIPVLQFNLMGNLKQFADISRIFGGYASNIREITLAQRGLEALNGLEIPQHLSQYGVKAEDVPAGRGG